jgi:hypothetical protein
MKKIGLLTFALSILLAVGCKEGTKENKESEKTDAVGVTDTIITITPFEGSPEFQDAKLSHAGDELLEVEPGPVDFDFTVENYELGVQTANAGENGLANSADGQHIHFILNNMPYSAHYENKFSREIEEGEHVLLAFLSRSFHESVKNEDAFVIRKIKAGNPSEVDKVDVDLSAEHLFYSRPKGTYKGEDTKTVLLDFFLLNTDLSQDGNKVQVSINDGEKFLITEWVPHVIENMPMGKNKIQLTLVDETLTPIPGPFNAVTRTITLEE